MRKLRPSVALGAVLLSLCTSSVQAQEHLEPLEAGAPALADYHQMLRRVFHAIYEGNVAVSAIVTPSFSPETAIAIKKDGSDYQVVTLTPREHLWRYALVDLMQDGTVRRLDEHTAEDEEEVLREIRSGLPERPEDVDLTRCHRPISSSTAVNLIAAWDAMLADVRPFDQDESYIVMDGTSYEYQSRSGGVSRSGAIYAPIQGRAEQLTVLTHELIEFCNRRTGQSRLVRLARSITGTT